MQINPHLQARLSRPPHRLLEILVRPLDIRITLILLERPVPDRYPHEIKPMSGDLLEVGQSAPGRPVRVQDVLRVRRFLTQGVFVDDGAAEGLEDGGRDPGLEDEPAADVETPDGGAAVGEIAAEEGRATRAC